MPDTTKRSWECDLCGKKFTEGDCGFNGRYNVSVYPLEGFGEHNRMDTNYVCSDCVEKIHSIGT